MEEKQKEKMKTYSYKNPEIELLKEYKDIEKNVNSGDLNFKSYSLNRDLEVYNFYLSKNVNESIDVFKRTLGISQTRICTSKCTLSCNFPISNQQLPSSSYSLGV